MKRLLPFFFVVCTLILFLYPLWLPGFPYTHDGENHLARIANYALALRQGQIPPRWAPSFWAGYGYPVFNYNYPLANILAIPLLALKVSVELTMKVLITGAMALGTWALWTVLKKRTNGVAAAVGTIVWLSAPFTFTNVYVRGAIGEILAYATFISAIASLDIIGKKRGVWQYLGLFLSVFSLSLAHNILALLLIPTILFKVIWNFRPIKKHLDVVAVITLALTSSLFFWLPALAEKNLITLDSVSVNNAYLQHFPTVDQLLTSTYRFGYSYPGPVDSLQFQIGIGVVAAVLFLILQAIVEKNTAKKKTIFSIVALFFTLIFLMTSSSSFIWSHVPFLNYIQFPWRLLGITSLVGAIASAYAISYSSSWLKYAYIFLVGTSVVIFIRHPLPDRFTHDDLYYKTFSQTTTILDENRPKTLQIEPAGLASYAPLVEDGVEVQLKTWNGSRHVYFVSATKQHEITEQTTYFPGWQVTIDGKQTVIDQEKGKGLIHFTVPAGSHKIVTQFTQWTPSRIVGNTLSATSLAVFVIFLIQKRKVHA
ncbi:MAG: 6-pyruvoyl-tetrahydropterin synthase-related protein [Patescibacteria group bacterium]